MEIAGGRVTRRGGLSENSRPSLVLPSSARSLVRSCWLPFYWLLLFALDIAPSASTTRALTTSAVLYTCRCGCGYLWGGGRWHLICSYCSTVGRQISRERDRGYSDICSPINFCAFLFLGRIVGFFLLFAFYFFLILLRCKCAAM